MKVVDFKRTLSVLEDNAEVYVKNMRTENVDKTTGLQIVWIERKSGFPLVEVVIQY